MVKHQPGLMLSMMGCRTPKAVAASAHRTRLADAAAVDDLSWFRSVKRVPRACLDKWSVKVCRKWVR